MATPITPDERLPFILRGDERFTYFLQCFDIAIGEVENPQILDTENTPSEALYELARYFGLLGNRGWLLATSTDSQRELLKRAIQLHKRAGTVWSVEQALSDAGFPNARIQEGVLLPGGGTDKWAIVIELDSTASIDSNAIGVPGTIRQLIEGLVRAWCPIYVRLDGVLVKIVVTLDGSRLLDGSTALDGLPV